VLGLPAGVVCSIWGIASGKRLQKTMENHQDPPFSMVKSTISMVIFNSYVKLPEGNGILQ